ncbi:hypothetical protein BD410DRAFT_797694 [Rickenella mellea]|uniref:Uncharacterized protein n=1 Tax=Rickenella mellea TaxID=50990 RepID=A0A4Y7PFM2_9AGAM|nr:hypothetical protein BD410DRAFT_797694 [Rickenella mellea]
MFAVNVESEGPYTPERIFPTSIRIMREKIAVLRKAAQALLADSDDGAMDATSESVSVERGINVAFTSEGTSDDVVMMET